MAKAPKHTTGKPACQQNPQKMDQSGKSADAALSDDDLKKVTGGPIYNSHSSTGGSGAG